MKITINPYDQKSINKAYEDILKYKQWLAAKETELLNRLAFLGATRVSLGFARASLEDTKPVNVTTTVIGNTATIIADGEQVCFIEFGTGVRFGYGYPGERPPGIVGIGEYGKGKGKNPKGWWYTGDDGKGKHTYGNYPYAPLYTTVTELAEQISTIARSVFNDR